MPAELRTLLDSERRNGYEAEDTVGSYCTVAHCMPGSGVPLAAEPVARCIHEQRDKWNSVLVFKRRLNGSLEPTGVFATEGLARWRPG